MHYGRIPRLVDSVGEHDIRPVCGVDDLVARAGHDRHGGAATITATRNTRAGRGSCASMPTVPGGR
jgi:hypothetical protein